MLGMEFTPIRLSVDENTFGVVRSYEILRLSAAPIWQKDHSW
jgi:hypothetical protein